MKRILIILTASLLLISGCAGRGGEGQHEEVTGAFTKAEPVGGVPEEYRAIIEGDLLNRRKGAVTAAFGRAALCAKTEDGWDIALYDAHGAELIRKTLPPDEDRPVVLVSPTSDGGLICVRGFMERQREDGSWATDGGFSSTVLKYAAEGRLQWEKELDGVLDESFVRFIEREGAYFFFGVYGEAPRDSYDHVIMMKLGENGELIKKNTVEGEDFDTLQRVDPTDEGFLLHINSQSRSGDFFPIKGETDEPHMHYGRYFTVSVDADLEKREVKLGGAERCFAEVKPVGFIGGRAVYSDDTGFSVPGRVTVVMESGGYTLVVSENVTGIFERTPPYISSYWYYTETVYSLFDAQGGLVCRRAYDSTPDYDAKIESLHAPLAGE